MWRDLDWLSAADKVAEDVGGRDALAAELIAVFDSQIAGGKRYDLAVAGRRCAHATYHESHAVDAATALAYSMDLTPLVRDPALSPLEYVQGLLDRFGNEVRKPLERLLGGHERRSPWGNGLRSSAARSWPFPSLRRYAQPK